MFSKNYNHQDAFTLIELLFTIAIISLLSALILNSLASAKMRTNDTKISEDLRQFRTAVDLYYNDNRTYPSTAMNYEDKNIAVQDKQYGWSNKLSFFVKTAEAAAVHTTPLCRNFDKVAASLVTSKYLTNVPVHPYDNDAKGICYKAVNSNGTFSAYASLTTLMNVGSGASAGTISKRTGFITGDTSSAGITNLIATTNSAAPTEIPYPIGVDAVTALDITKSADAINGVTAGIQGSGGTGSIITNTSSTAPVTYTLSTVALGEPLSGSISYTPVKASYSPGDIVVFTAIPGSGYLLTYWLGCTASTGNICTLVMNSNTVVQASFNRSYNFNVVNYFPAGGLVTYSPNQPKYLPGSTITVTASPYNGYTLTYWIGCTSTNGNTCTVTTDSADKTVYASFNAAY